MARIAALTALAALLLLPVAVASQGYPQLHIVALSQRADRASVEPGGVFRLTLHVTVAQRRERLDELILGAFENCQIISNETVRTVVPGGTDFVERLSVQALAPGEASISPAYIDALDPALGKPMRFSSNAVRVAVRGAPGVASGVAGISFARLALAAASVAGLFAAGFVLFTLFGRRRRFARPAVAPAVAVAPSPERPAGERLVRAVQAYRAARSPATLADVRGVLFGLSGIGPGATLLDALRALGNRDPALRAALLAAEDAAFGPALGRLAAGDALLAAVDAYVGTRPANEGAWTR